MFTLCDKVAANDIETIIKTPKRTEAIAINTTKVEGKGNEDEKKK